MTAARAILAACIALVTAGCGADADDTSAPQPSPTLSACMRAWKADHDRGGPLADTYAEFLPSIRACGSLGEWTRASRHFDAPIRGNEAVYVANACAEADAATQASEICVDAERLFRESG